MTTRVSDFHKVVVTSYKTAFLKSKSRVITCRNYILLNNNKFKSDLKNYFRVRKFHLIWRLKKSFFMFYRDMSQLNRFKTQLNTIKQQIMHHM